MENWIVVCITYGILLIAFIIAVIVAFCNYRTAKKCRIELEEQKQQVDILREKVISQKRKDPITDLSTLSLGNQLQYAISERDRMKQERDRLEFERNEFFEEILRLNGELEKANEYANLVGNAAINTNDACEKLLKENEELKKRLQ